MKSLLQETENFELYVDRKAVWLSTLKQIGEQDAAEVRKHTYDIKFLGEEGIDGGGLHIEWVSKVIEEVTHSSTGLFARTAENYLVPSPASKAVPGYRQHFRVFGRLLGKFFVDDELVRDLPLSPHVLRLLRNEQPDLEDMRDYDPQIYRSLRLLLDGPVGEDLGLSFSETTGLLGEQHEWELVPGGRGLALSEDNKEEYVRRYVHFRLVGSVSDQLQELLSGFRESCPSVECFSLAELRGLFADREALDVDAFERDVILRGCQKDTPEVRWFFEILRAFSPEEQRGVIRFMTSRERLPEDGFKSFKILLDSGESKLPYASTCDSRIMIGPAKSREELETKLRYAMGECEGFHRG